MASQRQLVWFCILVVLFCITITSCFGTLPENKPSTQRFAPKRLSLHNLGSTLQPNPRVGHFAHRRPRFNFHNASGSRPSSTRAPISVEEFGAQGIDHTDDTEAFKKAWREACSSHGTVVLLVPPYRSYFVKPLTFSGAKCKSSQLTMQIRGTILAFEDPETYRFPNKSKVQNWLNYLRERSELGG